MTSDNWQADLTGARRLAERGLELNSEDAGLYQRQVAILHMLEALNRAFRAYLTRPDLELDGAVIEAARAPGTPFGELLDRVRDETDLIRGDDRVRILQACQNVRNSIAHPDPEPLTAATLRHHADQVAQQIRDLGPGLFGSAYRTRQPEPPPERQRREPPPPPPAPPYRPRPWYRSSTFLWLTFFFCSPAWILLVLTDPTQSGCTRAFAWIYLILVVLVTCSTLGMIFFGPYLDELLGDLRLCLPVAFSLPLAT